MAHQFTWEVNSLYMQWFGTINAQELIHANSELVGNASFETIKYIIWDGSGIEKLDVDVDRTELFAKLASDINPYNRKIKVAFVCNRPEIRSLLAGYIDECKQLVPHAQQALFETIDEARDWAQH
ncbi:MAG: hypothetical protein HUJ29_10475 [Gammaproteobacteria bacterium]|nr:hypothetical protein [Gammaproteobacteria bacterium]